MPGIPSGDACGSGPSVGRPRRPWRSRSRPVATGSPLSVTRSTVAVADRRPRRRIVVRVERDRGARSGRIRTDMSEVNIQASGSSSRTTPAATSIMNATTLARTTAPWCSTSSLGCRWRREFTVIDTGEDAEPRRNGEGVVEKVGHRFVGFLMAQGRYRPPPGRDQLPDPGPIREHPLCPGGGPLPGRVANLIRTDDLARSPMKKPLPAPYQPLGSAHGSRRARARRQGADPSGVGAEKRQLERLAQLVGKGDDVEGDDGTRTTSSRIRLLLHGVRISRRRKPTSPSIVPRGHRVLADFTCERCRSINR